MPPHPENSGKPLFQKLGFLPGFTVGSVEPPDHYAELLSEATNVTFVTNGYELDAAHVFLNCSEDIAVAAFQAITRLRPGGMLWLSWARKSAEIHAGLSGGELRAQVLPLGWVDVKVCTVDADYSALKFLKRKAL